MTEIKKYIFITVSLCLLLFSAYIFVISVKAQIEYIEFDYQHEYREGAVLTITKNYLNNENPFALNTQPQSSYVYGFIYPMIASPFAGIFGNTLEVHRWVSYFFILLVCIIIFFALKSIKLNLVFCFAAAVILHQSLVNNGFISVARPEALGIFFFVTGILIPWKFNFSKMSCVVSIVLGILGFFTKPYYSFVIPFVGAYLFLFVSKRTSMFYLITSLFLFIPAILVVNSVYETYFNNIFFHPVNVAVNDFNHTKKQLVQYFNINLPLFLIILFASMIMIFAFWKTKLKNSQIKFSEVMKSKININANIFKNEPVIRINFNFLFLYVFLLSLILFIVKLGGNTGSSNAAYLFHIASPFLILTVFQFIACLNDKISEIVVSVLLIIALDRRFRPVEYDYSKSISCYRIIEALIEGKSDILNSPEIVSIMISQNKKVYDSGHSEYFKTGVSSLSLLTGASSGVEKRENEFEKEINNKILNGGFELILLSKKLYNPLLDASLIKNNYKCTDTLCAAMPYKNWEIEVWQKK